uniref:Uncharacterized protein n=1 Tax=uncultured Desulfobacterium sp. TaxID=201089 RepID=E1YMP3_9BACT|nr:unknown protein [uncultured Desulfobacterium sp.]
MPVIKSSMIGVSVSTFILITFWPKIGPYRQPSGPK